MEEQTNEQKPYESIKLIKNTKGYNWEVKIVGEVTNTYKITDEELKRLDYLNEQLKLKYGDKE